jgi:hypothetical protein
VGEIKTEGACETEECVSKLQIIFLCAFAPLRETYLCQRNNSRKGAKTQRETERMGFEYTLKQKDER